MPCEYCHSTQHTLSVCERVDVEFYANELRSMTLARPEQVTRQYVYNMRLPILKRLVRHLGGAMSQPRRVLEQRCIEYTELLRIREIIERERAVAAVAQQQQQQATHRANAMAIASRELTNRRIQAEEEAENVAAARGQRPRPDTIVQQMSNLSDQSWEERQARQENNAIVQIRQEQNRIHNEERSIRIRAFLRNMGIPSQQQALAQQQGGIASSAQQQALAQQQGDIASLAQAAPLATPPNTKPVIQVKVNPVDPTVCDKHASLETCCICLESDSYIQTNCGHVFCNCILQHTSKNGVKCPMCRQELTSLAYSCKTQFESTSRLGDMLNMGRVSYAFE